MADIPSTEHMYDPAMPYRRQTLTDARLESLYTGENFGGETTMRAKVIRELLIDEIRWMRRELADARALLEDRA